jgi:hypothetical protein
MLNAFGQAAAARRKVIDMSERRMNRGRSNDRRERRLATRLAYTIVHLAESAGVGRSMIYDEIRAGRLVASKAGRRTIVTRENAKAWLRGLPTANTSIRDTRPDE